MKTISKIRHRQFLKPTEMREMFTEVALKSPPKSYNFIIFFRQFNFHITGKVPGYLLRFQTIFFPFFKSTWLTFCGISKLLS